jgi:hypothetical protein
MVMLVARHGRVGEGPLMPTSANFRPAEPRHVMRDEKRFHAGWLRLGTNAIGSKEAANNDLRRSKKRGAFAQEHGD